MVNSGDELSDTTRNSLDVPLVEPHATCVVVTVVNTRSNAQKRTNFILLQFPLSPL